ncbi:MAG: hypothetical protein ACLP9L_42155 [Thermoguttaceae bacterium]|jgi:hypothetical protein
MSNATLERKCDLPQLVLEGILLDSKVPLKHWTEWFDLTYYGIRPSDAARHCRGSATALSRILTAISDRYFQEKGIKFPPKGWTPSKRQLTSVA